MNYMIYGQKIYIEKDLEYFNSFYQAYSKLIDTAHIKFKNKLSNISSLDIFLKENENIISDILIESIDFTINILCNKGIYDVDKKYFLMNYGEFFIEPWVNFTDNLYAFSNQIDINSNQMKQYREARKSYRGRFIGGGFGLNGAIKGIATASILNASSGLIHSGVNAIGNSFDSIKSASKKNKLFSSVEFLSLCLDCLSDCIIRIMNSLFYIIDFNTEKVTNDFNRGISITNNLKYIDKSKVKQILLESLSLNPYNKNTYLELLKLLGDGTKDLYNFSKKYAMDDILIQLKEDMLSISIGTNYKNDINECKKALKILSVEEVRLGLKNSFVYNNVLNTFNELDRKSRTVDNMVFKNIEDAEKAKYLRDSMDTLIKEINNISKDELEKFIDAYENNTDVNLKNLLDSKYKKIKSHLTELDIKERTFNNKVYNTKAERDIAESNYIKLLKSCNEEIVELIKNIDFSIINTDLYEKCSDILNSTKAKYGFLPESLEIKKLKSVINEYNKIKNNSINYEMNKITPVKFISKLIGCFFEAIFSFIICAILSFLAFTYIPGTILRNIIGWILALASIGNLFTPFSDLINEMKKNKDLKLHHKKFKQMKSS